MPTVRIRLCEAFGVHSSVVGLRVAAPDAPCSVYTASNLSSSHTARMMEVSAMMECLSRPLAE